MRGIACRRRSALGATAAVIAALLPLAALRGPTVAAAEPAMTGLHVVGNRIVNAAGQPVRILGVNRSGTQYMCMDNAGVFDGPTDAAAIEAITAWHATAVRVSLNEHCWLGINGAPATYSGDSYRRAIADFVSRLNAAGLAVIIDLHWNAPGAQGAREQQPMADLDHAPAFWSSVAAAFKDNHSVLFDLYNEPYPDDNRDTVAAWRCVRDGGTCPGVDFIAAGMQTLVDAVRATGASTPLLVGGPQYAGTVSRWLEYKPFDPLNQLVASIHIYEPSPCDKRSCWEGQVAPLARQVPVVIGEIGQMDCRHDFIDSLMTWADEHQLSYLGWGWVTGSCDSEPALIRDYDGTPTAYGTGLRNHLKTVAETPMMEPAPEATSAPTAPRTTEKKTTPATTAATVTATTLTTAKSTPTTTPPPLMEPTVAAPVAPLPTTGSASSTTSTSRRAEQPVAAGRAPGRGRPSIVAPAAIALAVVTTATVFGFRRRSSAP